MPYTIPVAQFKTDGAIVSSKTITINTEVNFTDNSTNYPTQWLWTVSPSTGWSYTSGSSSSKDAKIKFTANGNYTVSLKATNPAGNNTITKTTHITAKAIAPVANFNGNGSSATQINLEQNATVNFTDLSTNSPTAWAWSISPGTGWSYTSGSSTTANPTIKFTNGGVYSVSLTATNSGGSNSLTKSGYINITPAPPAVSSGITYCKGQTASQLTATGTSLKWYSSASGGTGTNTAPTPSTLNAGNTSYYVSQTVNGVESLRSLIKVIVNATSAPVVSDRNYCQGAVTSVLTASGSSLKWYSAPSGSVGSSAAPLPLSNTVGSTNYYVSQSLNGCESERANLVVTIVAVLVSPVVSSPINYKMDSVAQALTATGSDLKWYIGETALSTAPIPSTAVAGNTSYFVTQTVNGCESPKAEIIVKIIPPPAEIKTNTLSKSVYCINEAIVVSFTTTGKFANDNVFTAQLSDSEGFFTNPTNLGSNTLNTFSVAIPTSVTSGSKYRVRIIASNPNTIASDNGADLTINEIVSPTFTQVPEICSGGILDALSTTSTNGITGTWSPALNNLKTTLYTFTPTTGLCATTATMTVSVNSIDNSTSLNNSTLSSNQLGSTYQWINCNNGNSIIDGETNKEFTPTKNGSYAVNVFLNGCTIKSNCTSIESLALQAIIPSEEVKIYINPTNTVLYIQIQDPIYTIKIIDIAGRITSIKNFDNNAIDVSSLSNGVYILQIKTKDKILRAKFIKN